MQIIGSHRKLRSHHKPNSTEYHSLAKCFTWWGTCGFLFLISIFARSRIKCSLWFATFPFFISKKDVIEVNRVYLSVSYILIVTQLDSLKLRVTNLKEFIERRKKTSISNTMYRSPPCELLNIIWHNRKNEIKWKCSKQPWVKFADAWTNGNRVGIWFKNSQFYKI